VPAAVQAWAAGLGPGPPPTSTRDRPGGFSPGATTILEWSDHADGARGGDRSVFVKAVGLELNPDSPSFHRREIVVSAALPHSPRFPRLLGSYDDGDWVALAFEVVDGAPPHHPWRHDELERAVIALSGMHDELTPSPSTAPMTLAERGGSIFGGWADLLALAPASWSTSLQSDGVGSGPSPSRRPPPGLDPWALGHLERLAELEAGWPAACVGSTLVHGDVRSDNMLLTAEQVVFVDWPHAAVGNPAFDLVAWAPSVVLEGGLPPEELLALHAPTRRADPDEVTVLLAAIAGFFVSHSLQPDPPGLPTVRQFQAAQGEVALGWLRRRTGW